MRWTRRAVRWLSPSRAPKNNHFPARRATQVGADQAAPRETDRPRSGCWPRCPGTSDRRSPTTGPDCRPPTGQRGQRPTMVGAHGEGLGLTLPPEALVRPPVAPSGGTALDTVGHTGSRTPPSAHERRQTVRPPLGAGWGEVPNGGPRQPCGGHVGPLCQAPWAQTPCQRPNPCSRHPSNTIALTPQLQQPGLALEAAWWAAARREPQGGGSSLTPSVPGLLQ